MEKVYVYASGKYKHKQLFLDNVRERERQTEGFSKKSETDKRAWEGTQRHSHIDLIDRHGRRERYRDGISPFGERDSLY